MIRASLIAALVLAVVYVSAMPVEPSDNQQIIGKVPHPNSDEGRALANKDLTHEGQAKNDEKTVLEGGTQVKPWLKNQPDLANIKSQNTGEHHQ